MDEEKSCFTCVHFDRCKKPTRYLYFDDEEDEMVTCSPIIHEIKFKEYVRASDDIIKEREERVKGIEETDESSNFYTFIDTTILLFAYIGPIIFIGYLILYGFNNPDLNLKRVLIHSVRKLWWITVPYIFINIYAIVREIKHKNSKEVDYERNTRGRRN